VNVGQPVQLQIKVRAHVNLPNLVLGYMIKDRLGQPIFGTNTRHLKCEAHDVNIGENLGYHFSFYANLGEGTYSVATALADSVTNVSCNYEWRDRALIFHVVNTSLPTFIGSSYLPTHPHVVKGSEINE